MRRLLSQVVRKLNGQPNIDKLIKNGLQLGKDVHIGGHTIIDDSHCWLISIGDNCTLAPNVHVLAHDASTKRHLGFTKIGRVVIGERTFIGAGSIILPGVTLGTDVIIGAGSVVNRDIEDGSLAVGNPARIVGSTADYLRRERLRMEHRPVYPSRGWTLPGGISRANMEKMKDALRNTTGYVE